MNFQWVFGAAAAGCSLYSIRPYIHDLRSGRATGPSPVGWAVWAGVCVVLTAALALAGGRAQLGLTAAETVGCTVIAVWSWRLARRRAGRALDAEHLPRWLSVTTLAGGGVALAVVIASAAGLRLASPVAAACLLLGVDMAAGVVTVNDVRHDPKAESVTSWWWYGAGEAACLGTAAGHGWLFWAAPCSGLLIAAGIIGMAWRGGEHAHLLPRLPGWAGIPAACAAVVILAAGLETMAHLTMLPAAVPATRPAPHGFPRTHLPAHLPPSHHISRPPPAPLVLLVTVVASPRPQPSPSPHP